MIMNAFKLSSSFPEQSPVWLFPTPSHAHLHLPVSSHAKLPGAGKNMGLYTPTSSSMPEMSSLIYSTWHIPHNLSGFQVKLSSLCNPPDHHQELMASSPQASIILRSLLCLHCNPNLLILSVDLSIIPTGLWNSWGQGWAIHLLLQCLTCCLALNFPDIEVRQWCDRANLYWQLESACEAQLLNF